MRNALNGIDRILSRRVRRFLYVTLSAMLPFILAQTSQAASTSANAQPHVSITTIVAVIVGLVISGFYIRGMFLVLHYASETYDLDFDINAFNTDRSAAHNGLIVGSFLLVVLSALIISSYGWGSLFIYVGPILCLLGPIVVIGSMEADLVKYKQALRNHRAKADQEADRVLDSTYDIPQREFDSQTRP